MKGKLLVISIAVVVALTLLVGYNSIFAPKGVEGDKEVSLQIVIDKENIDESFTLNTDREFLLDLVMGNEEKLGASFKEYDFGTMIIGLMNYEANEDNKEYFHIYVNGEDSTLGPGQIPIKDGDKYKIELKTW